LRSIFILEDLKISTIGISGGGGASGTHQNYGTVSSIAFNVVDILAFLADIKKYNKIAVLKI